MTRLHRQLLNNVNVLLQQYMSFKLAKVHTLCDNVTDNEQPANDTIGGR